MDTMEFASNQEPKKIIEPGYDLLNLDSSEVERLKTRIEKWKGLVRMFIHPMYEKWKWSEEGYKARTDKAELEEIEQVLSKLLAMPEEKTPPILIMEEERCISQLQNWLRENPQGVSQSGVYFVKTIPNNSTPQIETQDEKGKWKILSEKLTELGVRKILMGGIQLEVSEFKQDWTKKGPWVARCVGIALSHLSKDKGGKFEVELSALTEPRKARNYYNKVKHKDGRIGSGWDF